MELYKKKLLLLFTQILDMRGKKWCEVTNLLAEYQCGFRSNRECLDNVFTLNALIQLKLNKKVEKLFALFVDFRRAFPSMKHDLL